MWIFESMTNAKYNCCMTLFLTTPGWCYLSALWALISFGDRKLEYAFQCVHVRWWHVSCVGISILLYLFSVKQWRAFTLITTQQERWTRPESWKKLGVVHILYIWLSRWYFSYTALWTDGFIKKTWLIIHPYISSYLNVIYTKKIYVRI